MKGKDHIEDYFKKHLEQYEESPDEDFWAKLAPAIEVQKQDRNYKVLWFLLLLLSLLFTGFLMGNINWGSNIESEKELPMVADHFLIDTLMNTENRIVIIQEEEKKIDEKSKKVEKVEMEKESDLTFKTSIVKPLIEENANTEIISANARSTDVSSLKRQGLRLLPSKIAELNYIAPELPTPPRSLTVQPYVSLHSYQLKGVTYEGIRQIDGMTTDRTISSPTNTIFNIGMDAGVILNEQFYFQVGFNQDYSLFTHTETIKRNLYEQEIAILFDGVPINFDFTMDTYFDEIEGKLKLTPKTTEIEAGEKNFSIIAIRKMNTSRWTFSTAYKIDVSNVLWLIPKVGFSRVKTQLKPYGVFLASQLPTYTNGQYIGNEFIVEVDKTFTNEPIELKNMEARFGFQTGISLGKKRNLILVPMTEVWFELRPTIDQVEFKLYKNNFTAGISLRYQIQ